MAKKPSKKQAWTLGALVAAAAGASTFITLWDDIGGPSIVTDTSPVIQALQKDVVDDGLEDRKLEIVVDDHRLEQISRYIREDKRELYDVQQRLKASPSDPDLIEQRIILEEVLEDASAEKTKIRKKAE